MAETSWQKVEYAPVSGVNTTDSEDSLQNGQVPSSTNFLFYGGEAFTRPGLNSQTISGMSAGVAFAQGLEYAGIGVMLVGTDGTLYVISNFSGAVATHITGPGVVSLFPNQLMAVVNGVVLIPGGGASGMQRFDPSGTTYTLLSAAPYRYVTGHLSRAVAAYDQSPSGLIGPRTVAWSKPGDETVWNTSPSIDGSGSAVLTDMPDAITGIAATKGVIIIGRATGFHIGTPTGIAIPAYSFSNWSYHGIGPVRSTLVADSDICYFVGPDDVYTFDTQKITPIGYNIKKQLFAEIQNGSLGQLFGFVTRNETTLGYKSYYHIMHGYGFGVSPGNHYIYDIHNDSWSVHSYGLATMIGGIESSEGVALLDNGNPAKLYNWAASQACESTALLTGPVHVLADLTQEADIQRILLKVRDFGHVHQVQVNLSGRTTVGFSSLSTFMGANVSDGAWTRQWVNLRAVGNLVQLGFNVPPGQKFSTNLYQLWYGDGGRHRE